MSQDHVKPDHIAHLHAFRGFAIINVLGAHAWTSLMYRVGGFDMADQMRELYAFILTVFHGSTIYFAVISGVLFSKVLAGRKSWASFYRNKLLNVILPYSVLSVFFLSALWDWYVNYAAANGLPTDYLPALLRGLLTGMTLPHFWYIPVLAVLFLLTPALNALRLRPELRWLSLALLLLPLLVSRTGLPNQASLQSIAYFTGCYFAGMVLGSHYDRALRLIQQHIVGLIALAGFTSIAIFTLYISGQNHDTGSILSPIESLFYVQKLSSSALVLYGFSRREQHLPKLLHQLGSYAFAIYFLHLVLVFVLARVLEMPLQNSDSSLLMFAGGGVVFVGSLILTLGLSMGLKRLFRGYSRMLIGA